MKICGIYSFNNGIETTQEKYPRLFQEIEELIAKIDASACKAKGDKKRSMSYRVSYSIYRLKRTFTFELLSRGWERKKVSCKYTTEFYEPSFKHRMINNGAFREMDFVKNRLGVELGFNKYAGMVYSGCAKMTISHNLGFIDAGVEIVPIKQFADEMSTGVSYFEQFVWDLESRGVSNVDIPVLILGIDA